MAKKAHGVRAVFLDRDGTLIREKNYLRRVKDIRLLSGAVRALKMLRSNGFKLILITNQSGIGRGYFTIAKLGQIHTHLQGMLSKKGAPLDGIYFCPHIPDDKCLCRKPRLGLIQKAKNKFKIDLQRSYSIGDHTGDFLLGQNAGGKGILLLSGHGKREKEKINGLHGAAPDHIAKNLLSAVRWVLKDSGAARAFVMLVLLLSSLASGGFCLDTVEVSSHTVQWGDTLSGIAQKYYGHASRYEDIARVNHLKNPDTIICGTVLILPPIDNKAHYEITNSSQEAMPMQAIVPAATRQVEVSVSSGIPGMASSKDSCMVEKSTPAFEVGEKLSFDVRWKFITVGHATMDIPEIEKVGDKPCYHIVTTARSTAFFDNFFKVRDVNESWMDTGNLCSLKFASHISENKTLRNETVIMDTENQRYLILESSKTGVIPRGVQDVLSSLYFLRTKNLTVGGEYIFDAHSGDTSWPLKVKVIRLETVKVPAGRFICYLVEPAIREGAGLFESRGKLQIWLMADDKKVPVLMRSKIAVGSVDAELTEMKLQ